MEASQAVDMEVKGRGGSGAVCAREDTDAGLMREIAEGSEAALTMLIEKWKNPLVNFVYASTHDFQLSEDIALSVFRKVYNARHSYRAEAKFSTFIFKIARNEVISEFRKNQVRPVSPTDFSDTVVAAPESSEGRLGDINEAFEKALAALPEKQRTAISLLVREELSYAEIAEIMGESIPAVKTLINRARVFLRESLKDFAQ